MKENINFYMEFESVFWDKPPKATVLLNDSVMFDGSIDQLNYRLNFNAVLEFGQQYTLTIRRYGKDAGQCVVLEDGSLKDQLLTLKLLKIDRTDVQNLIDTLSYNQPDYPEPWASEQRALGIELEELVPAETCWGHNGTWSLTFSSPFYKFLFKNLE